MKTHSGMTIQTYSDEAHSVYWLFMFLLLPAGLSCCFVRHFGQWKCDFGEVLSCSGLLFVVRFWMFPVPFKVSNKQSNSTSLRPLHLLFWTIYWNIEYFYPCNFGIEHSLSRWQWMISVSNILCIFKMLYVNGFSFWLGFVEPAGEFVST